jgi:SOS-response transcriptional repressor LexA
VIGNPPYSGVSSNMSDQAQRLIDAYKRVDGAALNERKLWLQDDYVKFIRLVQMSLERTGIGILGYITNHGYVGNPTFRGMRQSLMGTFQSISVLDLHGNANKQERSPDGSDDKNVFDIRQGVAILLATRASIAAAVMHADLWGERQPKYDWLIAHVAGSTPFTRVDPDSPYYFFEPLNTGSRDEYMTGWPLNEIMPVNAAGFITARDFFVVDLDESALSSRIAEFSRPDLSDDVVRDMYFKGYGSAKYPDGDTRSWKLPVARARVRSDSAWRSRVAKCLYRPFDERFVYWADWMVDWPRPEISGHLKSGRNISICFNRREELPVAYAHFLVTRLPCEHIALSGKTTDYQAPLWLYADPGQSGLGISESVEPNLAPAFLTAISSRLASGPSTEPTDPNAILQYIYAVVHSPTYRIRYAELLRTEFPRVPLPGGSVIFNELARLGDELVAVHLMESPRLEQIITTYIGPDNPHVGRVSWSDDTVWLDDAAPKKSAPANPVRAGFRGVPEAVWAFHVGSYHVCEKWLKDRKGRTLSDDDLAHYQKIVVALSESIRLMTEVDEVIEANGGWPAAFRTEETKSAGAAIIPFRPRIVRPTLVDRYAACVPLVPLEIAAGAFGDPQHVEEDDFEWVALDSTHRLRPGMFVAQVVGKSMEPAIPDGSYCLFSAPVAGSRVGKTVLVQLRDGVDPETGERYTVKRYDSQKDWEMEGLWQHRTITLRPNNPAFQPIVLTSAQEGDVKVIAELVEVLHGDA